MQAPLDMEGDLVYGVSRTLGLQTGVSDFGLDGIENGSIAELEG